MNPIGARGFRFMIDWLLVMATELVDTGTFITLVTLVVNGKREASVCLTGARALWDHEIPS